MTRAVRFDNYGSVDVLKVVDVERPEPSSGQVVVEVVSAGINPGEAKIREGLLHERWPATFPSGQGSDFAGRVAAIGTDVSTVQVGDEVIGFTDDRASQADYIAVDAANLTPKPAQVSWDEGGGLHVIGATAWAAVRAVSPQRGETIAVSGAAGGVGSVAVQLAARGGAHVIGIAGPANHEWLRSFGVEPVSYGDGLADRLRAAAPEGIDAFIDTQGDGYVELALELGVAPQRVDTIVDFDAVGKYGIKAEGNAAGSGAHVLAELAELIAAGELQLPIAATYPLEQVREAYTELGQGHTRGKIVLRLR